MLYQVTVGEQVVRVELRRAGDQAFVRVDDGLEAGGLELAGGVARDLAQGTVDLPEPAIELHLQRHAEEGADEDDPAEDLALNLGRQRREPIGSEEGVLAIEVVVAKQRVVPKTLGDGARTSYWAIGPMRWVETIGW